MDNLLTLLAVDFGQQSDDAFDFYCNNFHRDGNRLLIVHVVPQLTASTTKHTGENANEMQKLLIRNLQEKYENKMRSNNIAGRISMVYYSSHPGKVLCLVATKEKCAMLVVGRRRDAIHSDKFGSVLEYVLKKAPCPVVIVNQLHELNPSPNKPIQVPAIIITDNSAESISRAPVINDTSSHTTPSVTQNGAVVNEPRSRRINNPLIQLPALTGQHPSGAHPVTGTVEGQPRQRLFSHSTKNFESMPVVQETPAGGEQSENEQ